MLRATLTFTLVALCSAIAFVTGRNDMPNLAENPAAERSQIHPDHAAGLDQCIARLRLENVPLGQALNELADAGHLNIIVSWQWLKSAGIERTRLISLDLTNAKAGDALDTVLPRGIWNLHGGVISIGGDPDTEPRVYDIRDLVEDYVHYYFSTSASSAGASNSPDLSGRYFAGLSEYAQIVKLIVRQGSTSEISELAGRLIVNATSEEHARIAAELQALRDDFAKHNRRSAAR